MEEVFPVEEEKKNGTQEAAEKKVVDYTKYPEGFDAIVDMLDFIPEERRRATMLSLIDNLGRR